MVHWLVEEHAVRQLSPSYCCTTILSGWECFGTRASSAETEALALVTAFTVRSVLYLVLRYTQALGMHVVRVRLCDVPVPLMTQGNLC